MVNRKWSSSISIYGERKQAHISFLRLMSRTKRRTIILCRSGKKVAIRARFSVADQPHGPRKRAPTTQLNGRIPLKSYFENPGADIAGHSDPKLFRELRLPVAS